jgi:hypothetical protein
MSPCTYRAQKRRQASLRPPPLPTAALPDQSTRLFPLLGFEEAPVRSGCFQPAQSTILRSRHRRMPLAVLVLHTHDSTDPGVPKTRIHHRSDQCSARHIDCRQKSFATPREYSQLRSHYSSKRLLRATSLQGCRQGSLQPLLERASHRGSSQLHRESDRAGPR